MAKNIEINISDGSGGYEVLYPKTLWDNVDGGQSYVDSAINQNTENLTGWKKFLEFEVKTNPYTNWQTNGIVWKIANQPRDLLGMNEDLVVIYDLTWDVENVNLTSEKASVKLAPFFLDSSKYTGCFATHTIYKNDENFSISFKKIGAIFLGINTQDEDNYFCLSVIGNNYVSYEYFSLNPSTTDNSLVDLNIWHQSSGLSSIVTGKVILYKRPSFMNLKQFM